MRKNIVNARLTAALMALSAFALGALAWHQVYYVYSAAAFVWCLFEYHILGRKNRLHVP